MTMLWFKSTQLATLEAELADARVVSQSLAADFEQAQLELKTERTLRISAEAIADERLKQIERAYESLDRAEQERREVVNGRLASLDLVNSSMLKALAPEQAPTNLKEFSKNISEIPKRVNAVRNSKAADLEWTYKFVESAKKAREVKVQSTPQAENEPLVAAV